jgi:predicted O-methyltransferase YrrM
MYRHVFPKRAVGAEIGVFLGENACSLIQETNPTKLHLIDPWWRNREKFHRTALQVVEPYKSIIKIHRKSSAQAMKDFPDNYFDWVYVDGNHDYRVVREDLWGYYKKIKPGGILAGHDFSRPNSVRIKPPDWAGVKKAVHEFLNERLCELICFTWEDQRSFAMRRRES